MRDILIDLLVLLTNKTHNISYYVHPDVKDLKIVNKIFGLDNNTQWLLRCKNGLDDISFDSSDINHILLDTKQIIIVFEEDVLERARIS